MTPTHQTLVDQLVASGDLSGDWRAAFATVPREVFIPDGIWQPSDDGLQPLLRQHEPNKWLELVYSDEFIAIQADDGTTKPGEVGRYLSSSSSMPSVMATMLSTLDLQPHMSVLEIGTGTGWNTGILAARIGDEQVVSIEVDAALAAQARNNLARAGFQPLVVTGDGTDGHLAHAPYDRVLATASVQRVPTAWVEQSRAGGRIITPWGTAYHNGTLLTLTKHTDGSASGHFGGNVGFMWLRDQRTPFGRVEDRVHDDHVYTATMTSLHPYEPVSDFDGSFAVGLQVPHCLTTIVRDHQDDPYIIYFMDPDSQSWATLTLVENDHEHLVHQHGPRQLWNEIQHAHTWWTEHDKPDHTRFGLTATRNEQWVWLDRPTNVVMTPG